MVIGRHVVAHVACTCVAGVTGYMVGLGISRAAGTSAQAVNCVAACVTYSRFRTSNQSPKYVLYEMAVGKGNPLQGTGYWGPVGQSWVHTDRVERRDPAGRGTRKKYCRIGGEWCDDGLVPQAASFIDENSCEKWIPAPITVCRSVSSSSQ